MLLSLIFQFVCCFTWRLFRKLLYLPCKKLKCLDFDFSSLVISIVMTLIAGVHGQKDLTSVM